VALADALSVRSDRSEAGTAALRVGAGRIGRADAEVFLEEGRYHARLTGFMFGEPARGDVAADPVEAMEEPMTEELTHPSGLRTLLEMRSMDESTQSEGGELLNDIPLQIAVELARVPITAEQVVALRVGQVVDLEKVPGEPVELSVNGKIVARGELVEVEGHLGVRILTMAR